ncbi:MAG: cupin domain-containing protein, partial [Betaproteobacteria bacterium]
MERALLRGATAARFLARYWQQRPLLIRRAVDGFQGLLSWRECTDLATRDDVESRLVVHERSGWTLVHGPFRRS